MVIADIVSGLTGKSFPMFNSGQKFISHSEFKSAKNDLNSFQPPYTLTEGLDLTFKENLFSDPNRNFLYRINNEATYLKKLTYGLFSLNLFHKIY